MNRFLPFIAFLFLGYLAHSQITALEMIPLCDDLGDGETVNFYRIYAYADQSQELGVFSCGYDAYGEAYTPVGTVSLGWCNNKTAASIAQSDNSLNNQTCGDSLWNHQALQDILMNQHKILDASLLTTIQTSMTNVDSVAAVFERKYDGVAPAPVSTVILKNNGVVPGGSGYQNGVNLIFETDDRAYTVWRRNDGTVVTRAGVNAGNAGIFYDAINKSHREVLNPVSIGGHSEYNAAGIGGRLLFNYPHSAEVRGTGGSWFFDGVFGHEAFGVYKDGFASLGYNTAVTHGYKLVLGGKSYTTGQKGMLFIQAPTDLSNYVSYSAIRVLPVVHPLNGFVASVQLAQSSGKSNAYSIYSAGEDPSVHSSPITVGAVTRPKGVLDVVSTTSGALLPRMTDAQKGAMAAPQDGMIIYCTDCVRSDDASVGVYQYYQSSSATWKNMQ